MRTEAEKETGRGRLQKQRKQSCQNHSDTFVGLLRPNVDWWKTDIHKDVKGMSKQKGRKFLLLLNEFVGIGVNDAVKISFLFQFSEVSI